MNQKLQEKIDKIKTHFKNNKEKYYVGTVCFVAGAATAVVIIMNNKKEGNKTILFHEGEGDNNFADIMNQTYLQQTITRFGNKVGHPGNEVVELDKWGNVVDRPFFHSQTLAAKDVGVSDNAMFRHLEGDYANLNGREFRRLRDLLEEWRIMAEIMAYASKEEAA